MSCMTKMKGTLEDYFETGSEGVYWSFFEDGEYESPYDKLHLLQNGDYLTIYNPDDSIAWQGEIIEDRLSAFAERMPGKYENFGQATCGGLWVHWNQKDFDPLEWGAYFLKKFRAELDRTHVKPDSGRGPFQK